MAAEERMRIEVRSNTYDEKKDVIVMNSALVSSWNFALDHWRNYFGPGSTQLYPGSDLVVCEPCSLSSRLGPGACERCGRVLITRPDHYDVCTLCFRGLCYECGATCNLCFGSFCHGFCHCGCQQELGDVVVALGRTMLAKQESLEDDALTERMGRDNYNALTDWMDYRHKQQDKVRLDAAPKAPRPPAGPPPDALMASRTMSPAQNDTLQVRRFSDHKRRRSEPSTGNQEQPATRPWRSHLRR